ncbi:uncharacterized protein C8R40DRAFT_608789 [Lentinula edodes]|uniref:uncharacterized protein n=1 Tax=Lentinula edodes TaxID=5353 RepID=UPI001E8D2FA6|nr:uncharacterized protein C8R40DRAFT_608789 [Lentinula edodes]KAH7871036.1 hypothetical protein C8R40DRAFT_608789 [Lentinula edodes]
MFAFIHQLPSHEGGTAGNVLANRLTENWEFFVLMIKSRGTQVPAYVVAKKNSSDQILLGIGAAYQWTHVSNQEHLLYMVV